MNADDPILLQRRCDVRIPELGVVCTLEADHAGDHLADVDPVKLGQHLAHLTIALHADRHALDLALRANRRLTVAVVGISLVLLVNLGLRLAGL